MISEPKCGWCNFKLGSFIGHPSGYMTSVVTDLLDAFILFYKNGIGAAVFDEEGSYFTLILKQWNDVYIIEEKEKSTLFDFSEFNINDLAQELINDIENDFDNWIKFTEEEGGDQFSRVHIYNKICELKKLVRRKAL